MKFRFNLIKNTMKTLEKFLEKNKACEDGYLFAKDLTLEQFLNTCERGDWILWLFKRTNPKDLRAITLAKGHCAATVLHLMKDERSKAAVQAAIDFGENKINREELYAATVAIYPPLYCQSIFWFVAANATADAAYAKKKNQKETADICRKYLPLSIWNTNLI